MRPGTWGRAEQAARYRRNQLQHHDPVHPYAEPWWTDARCRGAGADALIVDRGGPRVASKLRARYCAGCPVAGACLKDAMSMPAGITDAGPMRCGLSGSTAYRAARRLVAQWQPITADDWDVLAAWVLDDRAEALSA